MNITKKNVLKLYSAHIDIYDESIQFEFSNKQIDLLTDADVSYESFNFNIRRFLRNTLSSNQTEQQHYKNLMDEIESHIEAKKLSYEVLDARSLGLYDDRFQSFFKSIINEIDSI